MNPRSSSGASSAAGSSGAASATAVTSVLAAQAGVWAVRVHDVAATRDSLAVAHAWNAGVPAETTDARARTADARGGTR